MGRKTTKVKLICQECSKEYYKYPCHASRSKFCSDECRLKVLVRETPKKRKDGEYELCVFCKKEFYVPNWKKKIGKGRYCSKKCFWNHRAILLKGDGNPQYIDGRTKKYKKAFYLTSEWRQLRKQIYKRDNYECQTCGKHGGRLEAHHKIPVGVCKDPLDTNNLITLCQKCHNKIHSELRKK